MSDNEKLPPEIEARLLERAAEGRRAHMALDLVSEVLGWQRDAIVKRICRFYGAGRLTPETAFAYCAELASVAALEIKLEQIAAAGESASGKVHGKPLTGNGEQA